ncbi:t-SNARE affecting a late Golgi compartment protein [Lachnellula hyalina]|uniref:t-SNARE affecting a late Golgi compartment protein 1 n=1 Tax=Lachnellula hyalina TaxID=1316788 RepID=A0A8H8R545_9HELO|nr:t-SNARE affecting a late Golgi compartment protein [Lachnellula hyalina]TVY27034.1 t-SNARE affecting a late Golgi compartment protein [Lachnellula hyalina]
MMSSTNEEDPFLQVQADVLTQLRATRPLFTSYLRIRSLTTTTSSPELASARTDLESSLSALADDLADLVESVQAVQSDPYKYGLEIEEVSRRQRLCEEVGGEVEDMKEELSKSTNKNGVIFDAADPEGREDNYAEFEQQQQVHMMAEQDTQLDSVFHTVGNLRQQASDMGRELEEQAEILDTTDVLADRVGGRLGTGMKKMGEVVRRNEDGLSSCCIGVLIFVLILLLVLVLVL